MPGLIVKGRVSIRPAPKAAKGVEAEIAAAIRQEIRKPTVFEMGHIRLLRAKGRNAFRDGPAP
jgi:hypothetical protein